MTVDPRTLLILSKIPGVGIIRLRSLVNHFGDPARVLEATPRELAAVEGIEEKTAVGIARFCRSVDMGAIHRALDDQMRRLQRIGGRIVSLWDKDYPANLKKIYDPPIVLFLRGSFDPRDTYAVAVVGTRDPSSYGVHCAERFATDLARNGLTVVSGLARGIDTTAHGAALRAQGRTIAVIGSGIDRIYPSENGPLAERITHAGAVVSEYEMGAKPDAVNFPRRNRIISGIAMATLVVETGVEGGAMITATTALDQNRDVFAVPFALSDKQKNNGTNVLIRESKAMLAESVADIVAELAPRLRGILHSSSPVPRELPSDLSLFERKIYDALPEDAPLHIDALAQRSGLSTADTLAHLLSLEIKGVVRQTPGKMFSRF
jgi:DNA processing protein